MNDHFRFFDKISFSVLMLIAFFGVILIYSASHPTGSSFHVRQLLWLLVSLVAFFVVFKIKTETVFRLAVPAYFLLVVILVLQIVTGKVIAGTRSWLKIGFMSFQVSEFVKIPLAILIAKKMAKIRIIDWKNFMQILVMLGVPVILIVLQPDMGISFILCSLLIIAVLLKRIRVSILVVSLIAVIAGSVVTWNYVLRPYQKDRVISFLNPQKYSQSSGYQIIQSRIAIGSGGLSGKGYLKGSQSQYEFLPTRHTDFIGSVLGEEMGFLGVSVLFLLFFVFFYRQFSFKTKSDEEFYFSYLFTGLILFQFLVNIMMVIGFFPVLGVPLPFVSYGGSSLLAFFIGEGIIFRIKLNNYLNEY